MFPPPIRISSHAKYPAEMALMVVGKPAVPAILKDLPTEENPLRRHLLCEVLKYVEGKDMAEAEIKQKLAEDSANLSLALKEFEK
jgi:hypothetical protein